MTPEGAAGLLLDAAGSPGGAGAAPGVCDAVVTTEGDEFSEMVSGKGLPPPPNENVSSWLGSSAGGAAPSKIEKVGNGMGVAEYGRHTSTDYF